jgi:hypothetical protein
VERIDNSRQSAPDLQLLATYKKKNTIGYQAKQLNVFELGGDYWNN